MLGVYKWVDIMAAVPARINDVRIAPFLGSLSPFKFNHLRGAGYIARAKFGPIFYSDIENLGSLSQVRDKWVCLAQQDF
jgi:hypothetical protein